MLHQPFTRHGPTHGNPSSRPHAPAFSLIELLVVVSIVSVLIALLLPSLERSRDVAKQLRCSANLQQINLAQAFYRNDYNDKVVAGRLSYDAGATIWQYILSQGFGAIKGTGYITDFWLLRCPVANYSTGSNIYIYNNSSMVQWDFRSAPTGPGPKGGPIALGITPYNRWLRLSDYGRPDKVIQLLDTQSPTSWQTSWSFAVRYYATGSGPNPPRVGNFHSNGTNLLWLDGHVSWMLVNSTFFIPSTSMDWTTIP